MNGWGILGLVLFSLAAGASITLWPYRSMKAENERLHKEIDILDERIEHWRVDWHIAATERDTAIAERDTLTRELEKLLTERNALKEGHAAELEKYRKHFEGLKEDVRKANGAMLSLSNECDALRLQLDEALRPKSPPPSDGTKKPRKIKPTSLEPPSTV